MFSDFYGEHCFFAIHNKHSVDAGSIFYVHIVHVPTTIQYTIFSDSDLSYDRYYPIKNK